MGTPAYVVLPRATIAARPLAGAVGPIMRLRVNRAAIGLESTDEHRVDERYTGDRRLRRRQRHQPVLRDARERAAPRPAPRQAGLGRDVRADPPPPRGVAPGHRR